MRYLRVPESRFESLKDYTFEPHFLYFDKLRMHYVDEGPQDSNPILMLHGNPSWSYVYRHMITRCASAGNRVIAPDLIGFGKSDKLEKSSDYSYQAHVGWMTGLIESLDLKNIVLYCQDWGALIGLRLAAENEERFAGIVVANGVLPTGDQKVPFLFKIWKYFALFSPWLPIDLIVDSGCLKKLDKEEKRAYRAPFPSSKYKISVRIFPKLVPVTTGDPSTPANRKAWEILKRWKKPFLTLFSDGDPIARGGDAYLQKRIPGAEGQKHTTLPGGHFLQEDAGIELAEIINQFVSDIHIEGGNQERSLNHQ
ncbi:MAG: haloalkane dehalogenase [Candidatus Sabulitectum sp.]|nr:haloalkane dehalogenase [Candidatus Sabulitectum sp.]